MIKELYSKQIIHILIFVSRSWGRAREGAGLEVTNGAEEEEDMGGGLRHLPSRKTDSSPRLWGEKQCNADSRGGMKNWQEEKAGRKASFLDISN